jgi:hypothetical protein
MGGGLSGGSNTRECAVTTGRWASSAPPLTNGNENVAVMHAEAVQAERHAATESAPSGQHGQSPESACIVPMPIISAQGILSGEWAAGSAFTTGAAHTSCATTSTRTRMRFQRFTGTNIDLCG